MSRDARFVTVVMNTAKGARVSRGEGKRLPDRLFGRDALVHGLRGPIDHAQSAPTRGMFSLPGAIGSSIEPPLTCVVPIPPTTHHPLPPRGTGMSVMEMSHRGKDFMKIASEAEADFRELVGIPDNYKVLFLQGGASSQFAAIPMNLAPEGGVADFIVTGAWGKKALEEAGKYMDTNVVATSKASNFSTIPPVSEWKLTPGAKFVHICSNETIGGVEFKDIPDTGDVPLVADMSSNYLSKPIDVKRYGVIYGGVQKVRVAFPKL